MMEEQFVKLFIIYVPSTPSHIGRVKYEYKEYILEIKTHVQSGKHREKF